MGAGGGADAAAFGRQEGGHVPNSGLVDVEGGGTRNHVEPFRWTGMFRHLAFYLGLHVHARGTTVHTPMSPFGCSRISSRFLNSLRSSQCEKCEIGQ